MFFAIFLRAWLMVCRADWPNRKQAAPVDVTDASYHRWQELEVDATDASSSDGEMLSEYLTSASPQVARTLGEDGAPDDRGLEN